MKHQDNKRSKATPDKSLEKSLDTSTIRTLQQRGDRGQARQQDSRQQQTRQQAANQGEGNREAARRYNEDQQRFVQTGKAEAAARGAAPASEREGRRHAKDEDPTVPGANAQRPGRDPLGSSD